MALIVVTKAKEDEFSRWRWGGVGWGDKAAAQGSVFEVCPDAKNSSFRLHRVRADVELPVEVLIMFARDFSELTLNRMPGSACCDASWQSLPLCKGTGYARQT